jgi:hypothetical protein
MKKSYGFSQVTGICLAVLTLLSSCISSQSFFPVKGNGDTVEKTFNTTDFHGIEVSGGFDVTLTQGTSEGVTVSAQENLFEYIQVEVVQGVLKIYTDGNLMPTRSMKAQIAFKNLDQLRVSGGGDVVSQTDINVQDLDIELSGGGNLTTIIKADMLNCRLSGGGDARIDGNVTKYDINMSGGGDLVSSMDAGTVFCHLSGGGNLTLKSGKEADEVNIDLAGGGNADANINTALLKCSVSGGGNADFSGKASQMEININGGGDINASGLEVATASIQASGGSDVHVMVSGELKGNISGGGDIYYSGAPEIVTIDARGGSKVHKE